MRAGMLLLRLRGEWMFSVRLSAGCGCAFVLVLLKDPTPVVGKQCEWRHTGAAAGAPGHTAGAFALLHLSVA